VLTGVVAFWSVAVGAAEPYPQSVPRPPEGPEPRSERLEILARDGTHLVVQEWMPAAAAKRVVVLLHGIGMHGAPYAAIAPGFTARNITLVVPDLRGHGRSGGERGVLAEPHVLRADLGAVFGWVEKRHPNTPVILAGESMGGLLAADYAWRGERGLAGLALLAPAFRLHLSRLQRLPPLGELLQPGRVFLDAEDILAVSTRDARFLRARKDDDLALAQVQWGYLATLGGLQAERLRMAEEIRVPLFLGTAGQDRIIDNEAAQEFYARAGTPKGEKTWRRWDAAWHTLCWDPATPQIVQELAEWTLERGQK
jgi:alpha-beta hydrolase superfamily lysophospholipase